MSNSEYWTKFTEKRLSRRRVLQGGAAIGAGLWIGSTLGCGSENKQNQQGGGTTPQAGTSAQPTATVQPKYGGILYRRDTYDPRSLDPDLETTPAASFAPTLASNGLLKFNRESTKIITDLADSFEQPDDVTYIFKLHPGVKFHNVPPVNGREFVADDVKFSIERQMTNQPTFVHAYYFKGEIAKIEAVDKYTVKFTTNAPYAPFLAWIANPFSVMKCREVVDRDGDLKLTAVGTGPFIFKEWKKGVETVMVRNPDYFKKGKPYLDEIHARYVPDNTTAATMFVSGDLDVLAIDWSLDEQTRKQRPNATYIPKVESMYPFILRTQPWDDQRPHKPPMDNLKVRQAIQYATDKQEYIDVAFGGNGYQMVGMVAPSRIPWALPDSDQTKQDIPKAKQLMAEAGYPNGFKMECIGSNIPSITDSIQVTKGQLAKIGIDIDIKLMEDAQYRNKVYAFDYMLNLHNMLGNSEPEDYFKPYYGANATYYRWGDKDLQDKIAAQSRIMDPEKRKQAIWEIQRIIQQQAPQVPLYVAHSTTGVQARVKGLILAWNQYDFSFYEDVWLA